MPHLPKAAIRSRKTGGWNSWNRQQVYIISCWNTSGTQKELSSGVVPFRKDGTIP